MDYLPSEVLCHIIAERPLSLEEVRDLSLVSTRYRDVVRSCLKYLFSKPLEVTDDYISSGGITHSLYPDFIMLFPHLVGTDYPIKITSLDQLNLISRLKYLKEVTFDLEPLERLMEVDKQPLIIANSLTYWSNTSDAVVIFINRYLLRHKDPIDIKFTFLTREYQITYCRHSICVKPIFDQPSPTVDLDLMIRGINQYDPLYNYSGPTPVPDDIAWQSICLHGDNIDKDEVADLLIKTKASRLGIDLDDDLDWSFLSYLYDNNIVVPDLKIFDYPVSYSDLPILHIVMPNVKEPLLIPFEGLQPLPDVSYLTGFRLLPNESYPQLPLPVYVDYSSFPCKCCP